MFKEISIDNWILGGTIFLLIFTLGCFLWFQNEMAYLQQDSDTDVEMQYLEKSSETEQLETPRIELSDTVQPDTFEKSRADIKDTSPVTSNFSPTSQENRRNDKAGVPFALIGNNKEKVIH